MKISPKNLGVLLVAIAALTISVRLCYLQTANETSTTLLDKYYAFDSSTVLHSIIQGGDNVLTPLAESPEVNVSTGIAVDWNQAEYLKLAEYIYEFVWNESMEEAELNSASFTLDCEDVTKGFQNARFRFIKIVNSDRGQTRLERNILFESTNNFVNVWEVEYLPNLGGWKTIDLTKTKITAESALEIAERSGGSEKREGINNECFITVNLFPDSVNYKGWRVGYQSDSKFFFNLWIDPFTGEIEN